MTKPVTWEQLIQAAGKANTNIAAQGRRAESLTVWFNALLASAGGAVIAKNSTDPTQIQLGLQTPAGDRAAQVMSEFANSGREGPAFSTAGEDESVAAFQAGTAGWMVNWPFVWSKAKSGVKGGTLSQSVVDDYGWAIYPRVDADRDAAPPYGGINLGVGAFSKHPDLAYAATECITSTANQKDYFLTNGNPASRASVFSDPEVLKDFPMAPTIEQSLQLAAPRPQTPYYSEVSGSIQREYHPPANVSPATGASTTELIQAVLSGRQLL
jgi:multiple sugar transport system substrate-binding protein